MPSPDDSEIASECQHQLVLALRLFKAASFWVSPWDRQGDVLIPLGSRSRYSLDKDEVRKFCSFSRRLAELHVWRNVYSFVRFYRPVFEERLPEILPHDDPQGRKLLASKAHLVVAADFFERAHGDWRLPTELRLLFLTIAAEALFGDGNQDLAYRLAHRIAVLNGADRPGRKNVFDMARKIYDLRSRLAHGELYRKGAFLDVPAADVTAFSNVVRSSLLYGVALADIERSSLLKTLDRGVFDEAEVLKLRFKANTYWGFGESADEHLCAGTWGELGG